MEKIIHYCWFGGKPLPKLAKKCIKSWKKYLPDYKIVEWNENNFDVNITKFSKQAYETKKWAFVSDVARIYALKEFGGIYFDTDMIVTKDISYLLNDDLFAGWESEYNVAVGVLGVSRKNNKLINKIWDFYCENDFSEEAVYSLTIPVILTTILKNDYNLKSKHMENQKLDDNIMIYARDYFYPISSDNSPNLFTDRTCMIHYYVGSWLSNSEKKRIKFQMIFGKKLGNLILNFLVFVKRVIKNVTKIILFPYVKYRRKKALRKSIELSKESFDNQFQLLNDKYIVFYNNNWLGTKNATKELFNNVIGIDEIVNDEIVQYIGDAIINKKIGLVVFSAFSFGWEKIIKYLKQHDSGIKIKVIWHGSLAMNVESYDWNRFEEVFRLLEMSYLDSIGFVKKSMYDFFKQKGYNVELILNTVSVNIDNIDLENDSQMRIGLYASGDRWVKNFYNQLGAASLFENALIDCVPLNEKSIKMARIFNLTIQGLNANVSRDDLLIRMSKNKINFYVTFSECAPLIPLESLEVGVPCITGNNHHYFEGSKLRDYLVVDEADNCVKIYEKAKFCVDNRDEIIKLYKEWKKEYDKMAKASVKKFLEKG